MSIIYVQIFFVGCVMLRSCFVAAVSVGIICSITSTASASEDDSAKNLTFFGTVVYGPRDISGNIFVNRSGPATATATAEDLGLSTSRSFQYKLGAQYKRWRFSLNYMPTNYTGNGFTDLDISIGDLPPISAKTSVSSNIDVNLLLADISYDVLRNERWVASLGVGVGRTEMDIALVPNVGQPLAFDGATPFGYIGGDLRYSFAKRWNVLLGLQWISGNFDGSSVDYGNYNVELSYALTQKRLRTNLVAGYRRVDFKFDYNVSGEQVDTDVTLEGPYVGLSFAL